MSAASVANVLEEDALQLYSLIWARTMACQLEPAVSNQVWMMYMISNDVYLIRCPTSDKSVLHLVAEEH